MTSPAASPPTSVCATDAPRPVPDPDLGRRVARLIRRRNFAELATSSPTGRAHVAGVLYQLAEGDLWISTLRSSRKARNVAANPWVAVSVPVRRLPVGPPSGVQLQARAEVRSSDDPLLRRLADAGALPNVTGHGELDLPDGCFLRVTLPSRVPVYGLGMSLMRLVRDPMSAGRVAEVDWS